LASVQFPFIAGGRRARSYNYIEATVHEELHCLSKFENLTMIGGYPIDSQLIERIR